MNLVIARIIAADLENRTEPDVRAAHKALAAEVGRYHRRSLPAPHGLFQAHQRVKQYLSALDGVAA